MEDGRKKLIILNFFLYTFTVVFYLKGMEKVFLAFGTISIIGNMYLDNSYNKLKESKFRDFLIITAIILVFAPIKDKSIELIISELIFTIYYIYLYKSPVIVEKNLEDMNQIYTFKF